MINETWRGYYISKRIKNSEFSLYVKSIYRGKITWTTDYTYARRYAEKTAKRIDDEIEEALLNDTFGNDRIIPDAMVKDEPRFIEEPKVVRPVINITTDTNLIDPDGWDFPIEELGYLLKEHTGETFVLVDDRLYEAIQ